MHQAVSYFDWYALLGFWIAALWFWIPGFRFEVESNNSWYIQLGERLSVIYLLLFLQVLCPPWTRLVRRTRSIGIRVFRVSLLWVLQEVCVPVIWRQMMLSISFSLPGTGFYSTRVILGNTSGTWFDNIVSWVYRCLPWQKYVWIVSFWMNFHGSHTSSQPPGIRYFFRLVPLRHRRQAYPLLRNSGRTSSTSRDSLLSSWLGKILQIIIYCQALGSFCHRVLTFTWRP